MPIDSTPRKNSRHPIFNPIAKGEYPRSASPINKLESPHRKLTNEDELPTPCGFANGVGKGSPRKPQARCGMQLHKKSPAAKFAR